MEAFVKIEHCKLGRIMKIEFGDFVCQEYRFIKSNLFEGDMTVLKGHLHKSIGGCWNG